MIRIAKMRRTGAGGSASRPSRKGSDGDSDGILNPRPSCHHRKARITVEPGKRRGKPCVHGLSHQRLGRTWMTQRWDDRRLDSIRIPGSREGGLPGGTSMLRATGIPLDYVRAQSCKRCCLTPVPHELESRRPSRPPPSPELPNPARTRNSDGRSRAPSPFSR